MADRYQAGEVERRWQAEWERTGLYHAHEDAPGGKYYALVMFPCSSGDLHIGHWYNFGIADSHARYKRMQGYNVLEPIGFDAFGLPAEEAAISRNIHPKDWALS